MTGVAALQIPALRGRERSHPKCQNRPAVIASALFMGPPCERQRVINAEVAPIDGGSMTVGQEKTHTGIGLALARLVPGPLVKMALDQRNATDFLTNCSGAGGRT